MFWPTVLPFKIAFWLLVVITITATVFAPSLKWKRKSTFLIGCALSAIAIIPSCTGIMLILDSSRFGLFEHSNYSEVKDFRIERFLPTSSKDIFLHKRENGHRAKYKISDDDFHLYLNNLWDLYGKYSAVKREEISGEGSLVTEKDFNMHFEDLGWKPLNNALKFHSPVEGDGGGATYYFDPDTGIAYHDVSYW